MVQFTNSAVDGRTNPQPANDPRTNPQAAPKTGAAKSLEPAARRQVALEVLGGKQSASQAARDLDVSRKFIATQTAKADAALDAAFAPPEASDQKVLFYIPVTKAWLRSVVLGLVLIAHCSLRGVIEFMRDLLGYDLSLGTVHNILADAVPQAKYHNEAMDLRDVRIGALDEIFQNGQPVLVGCDADSTYCFLLSLEERRDSGTWKRRLDELKNRHFNPDSTIADFAGGLRAGAREALPEKNCRGDLFHAQYALRDALKILENKAYHALGTRQRLQAEQKKYRFKHGGPNGELTKREKTAAEAEAAAITLVDDLTLLIEWLSHDVLSVAGPCFAERQTLYDFILSELRQREANGGVALSKVITTLANHRDDLLAFVVDLDRDLTALAAEFQLPPAVVYEVMTHLDADTRRPEYWQQEEALHRRAKGRLHELKSRIKEICERVVRASSVVENLNSRLRGYFFLRRELGVGYLQLLQFFLNHRRFMRSEHPERAGKSPYELLTGFEHPHWLELLGYQRFEHN